MKIISWNVNGIRAIMKKDFLKDINTLNPDVFCLQETKAQVDQVNEALAELQGYYIYANHAERKGYSGTAICSKTEPLSITYDIGIEEHDKEGRVVTAEFDQFYLVTVYVPNSGQGLVRLDYRETWDRDLLAYLKNLEKTKPVVLCGDLNVAHKAIDLANPKSNYNKTAGYTQKEINGLDKILIDGFIDTWRHFHPDEVKYSCLLYTSPSPRDRTRSRMPSSA